MNNDKGKLYYGVGLDNAQLRADATESRNIIRGIGDSVASEGNRIDGIYRKIGGAIAVAFSAREAANFAKHIVQVRGEIESLEISFQTLLGNKQKADALFSEIRTFAVNTPMQMNDLAKGAQMLLSFNVEAERVMPILKQIGDISMGDSQKFNSLTLAFSQMSSTGKLMGQDLLQMINAGFNPLTVMAEKSGKSVAQLKKEMEGGLVTSQMVADAFAAATAEGGKFYGMLEKQSKGINGSISNLQGAIQDMFNDIGTANQDFITDAVQGATTVVRHYQEIGEALAVIIGIYGTYRAAIIATEAVRRSITTVQHTEEAAELYKLLTAEQQAKISKQGLSKSSAEYYALVKAETAANVQATQSTLVKARADVKAASESVVARRAEYIAAKQLEEQRLAELMSIGATGSAKQVEAAQRKLSAAETQRESAAIAFQSATRDFNTKKTVVETAARTANTTSAAVNTAAETANATATGFLTVAKTRLTAVAARLNAVIMANPYALAAAAVIALGYGIYKLVTYQTDAEKAQNKLNDAVKECDKNMGSEVRQIDAMFARLKAAKQGTDEYRSAKDAIMNRYGEYLKKLGDEKTALNDIAAAYTLITEEAKKAARARAMESFTKDAADTLTEKEVDAKDEVKKLIDKKYKGKKGEDGISLSETYYWKIKPVIEGEAEITPEIENILKDFDKAGGYMSGGSPMFGGGTWVSTVSNSLRDELNKATKARDIFNESMNAARMKFGENPTDNNDKNTFDATTASLQQLMDRLPKAKEELAALKKAEQPDASAMATKEKEIQQIKDQTTAREKSLTAIKDVKAQIELLTKEQEKYGKNDAEYKALGTRIKSLKTKLPTTEGQDNKSENDAARIKRETAERTQKIQEYAEAVVKEVKQSELDIAQARIDAMDEGFDKEMAQNELAYNRLIFANQQREAEMLEALRDARQLEWENKNPKAKDKGETFDRSTVTVADLSSEQKSSISEYYKVAEDIREKANKDSLEKILSDVMTYEQQRTKIAEDYAKQREQLYNHDKDGNRTGLKQGIEQGNVDELDRNEQEALTRLSQAMMEESDLWVRLFEDASKKTVSQIEGIIAETQALLDYLQGKNGAVIPVGFSEDDLKSLKGSPEAIKKIQDAIKRLKGEIGSKSPFKQFTNDINEAIDQIKAGGKDNIGAGIMNIGAAVNTISPYVKQFGNDLGEIFGDSDIGENIGILTDTLAGLGTAAAGVGQIMTGDILGGISSIVSGVASIFSMANDAARRHKEALQAIMEAKIAQQREYNLMLLEQNLLYEKGITIFGTDEYGKAINAVKNYKDALSQLGKAMEGTDEQKDAQKKRNYSLSRFFGVNVPKAALKEQYAGLASMQIVTGHIKTGLFGWGKGEDTYSSVLDVYPELIKANGDFDKSLAEVIISTREMDDSAKDALQNMIGLAEQYEQAMQEVRDYLTDIFGDLGNTMSNALADAFANGTDAADAFFDSVSDMLENLAKQMIYSVTIAPLMEKAQEQMLATMQTEGLTDEQKFNQYAEILANLTNDALAQQEYANVLYQQYQDMAAAKGFDIFGSDASREASSKGIATASQDSVNELNGRATAIQGHTFDIREAVNAIALNKSEIDISSIEANIEYLPNISANVLDIQESTKILADNSKNTLELLLGIESNTGRLHSMGDDIADVRLGVTEMRQTVNDIALKGIKLK